MIRQIILVASKGDTIELGLQIVPQSPSMTPRIALPLTAADVRQHRNPSASTARSSSPGRTLPSPPSGHVDGPVLCVFEIVHNIYQPSGSHAETPRAGIDPFSHTEEAREIPKPRLESLLCRRILAQQNASLKLDSSSSSPLNNGVPRRSYELSVLLSRGEPFDEPPHLSAAEEAVRQPFLTMRLAREPTLAELSGFAESLRGKKVFLHANLTSLFARHLTSYLAAWGLDISHIPIEETNEMDRLPANAAIERQDSGYSGSVGSTPAKELGAEISASLSPNGHRDTDKFIIIDDDVTILRCELIRLRIASNSFSLRPRMAKRPTLASRARSTPHVRQASTALFVGPVLIHFTSLANYNHVRDVVSNFLGTPWSHGSGAFARPEVMVIPKPVGPRRFLTALHTAVNQPVVDPFFSPIATSPRSPGGGYFTGFAGAGRTPTGELVREGGFFDTVTEEASEDMSHIVSEMTVQQSQKSKSPLGELPQLGTQIVRAEEGRRLSLPTPGDLVATPASEYFSNTKSGASSISAMVMQSPDGRPLGMFFEPPVKGDGRRVSYTQRPPIDTIRRRTVSRRTSAATVDENTAKSPKMSQQSDRRLSSTSDRRLSSTSAANNGADESLGRPRQGSAARTENVTSVSGSTAATHGGSRRKTLPANEAEPFIAVGRDRSATLTQRSVSNTPISSPKVASPKTKNEDMKSTLSSLQTPRVVKNAELDNIRRTPIQPKLTEMLRPKKGDKDEVIVPPINVLIVEGE